MHHGTSTGALDVFKVAGLLVSHALAAHGEEIDIIAYYGSHAQGVAKETSDLDIFYIPADGKNPPVGRTVLIEGLLFDFWGIPWHTMEGFATGRDRGWSFAPAIVHHAKVLHARSDEQASRFAALKQQVLDLQTPEARPQMIRRALDSFRNVEAHLGKLHLAATAGDLTDVRSAGWGIILAAWECLCLANQTFSERGWAYLLDDIPRLEHRPEDLAAAITIISTSDDVPAIIAAAEDLALGTYRVLQERRTMVMMPQAPHEVFESAYPELKDGLGKVLRSCERGHAVAASAAAWSVQSELSAMLHDLGQDAKDSGRERYSSVTPLFWRLGFPDLLGRRHADLDSLAQDARLLDGRLRRWLSEQGVDLNEFETLEAFERSLC